MRVEVIKLLSLKFHPNWATNTIIGDGVYLDEIRMSGWLEEFCKQLAVENQDFYQELIACERNQGNRGPFTHRLYISLPSGASWDDKPVERAKNLIYRATVLSRIVKPTPVALHGAMYLSQSPDSGRGLVLPSVDPGFYGNAYADKRYAPWTITASDAEGIRKCWPGFQRFFDEYPKHMRIIRALHFLNDGYHVRPTNLRQIILHAALESLICTKSSQNRKQVTKRLPQLTKFTEDQASAIYDLCLDVKHRAAPSLLVSDDVKNLAPQDQRRHDAVLWLEDSLRELLVKAIENPSFADELADPVVLEKKYPV